MHAVAARCMLTARCMHAVCTPCTLYELARRMQLCTLYSPVVEIRFGAAPARAGRRTEVIGIL